MLLRVTAWAVFLLLVLTRIPAPVVLAAAGGAGGDGSAPCSAAAGLNLAIGEPPQPGSVDANGNLILYCRTPAMNSRDGVYTRGTNTEYTQPTTGASCSVDVRGGEGAQVLSEPEYESGWEGGPGTVKVFPIAFWTGAEDAVFQVQSQHFLWGGVSDTTQTTLDANWSSASSYGPPPPSDQPGSGLATSAMITSGLQNQTVEVWIADRGSGLLGAQRQRGVGMRRTHPQRQPPDRGRHHAIVSDTPGRTHLGHAH